MKTSIAKTVTIIIAVLVLAGCKQQINVPEGGHVKTQSGEICQEGQTCTFEVTDTTFDETFVAVPAEGYVFAGWKKGRGYFCANKKARLKPCRLFTSFFPDWPNLYAFLATDETFYLEPIFKRAFFDGLDMVLRGKPAPRQIDGFPKITIIESESTVTPGNVLRMKINLESSADEIVDIIVAQADAKAYAIFFATDATEIGDDYIIFEVELSAALKTEETLGLDVAVVGSGGRISNYHRISVQLSADEEFSIIDYSGKRNAEDFVGNWKVDYTFSNGDVGISQWLITQSETGLIRTEKDHYSPLRNGVITGNANYVTFTFEETWSDPSWIRDFHIDHWHTCSGKIINSNKVVGECNWIIKKTYGDDTNGYEASSGIDKFVMTRGFSPQDDHGNEISTSTHIPLNMEIKGSLETSSDTDVFDFWANPEEKPYLIEISGSLENGEITLYDYYGTFLASGEGRFLWTPLPRDRGSWYGTFIKIGGNGTTGSYTITVTEQ